MTSRTRSVNDYASARALRKALAAVEEEPGKLDESTMSASVRMTQCSDQDSADTELREGWDWVLTNYDVGTTQPQSISQELHRLQVLKSYLILDADREEAFERLTNMASRIFQVPIALVSLVDLGRQWFMSNHGLGDVRETPRSLAFCAHAVQGRNDLFIVKETLEDPRFCGSALVQGAPFIRFYAGAPLLSPEGYKLGTFCIIDDKPWPNGLTQDQQDTLKDFAAMAMKAMVDRRQIASQHDTAHLVACTAHDLLTPLMGVQLSLSLLEEEATSSMSEHHQECLSNAIRSSDWLHRICQNTIETLRTEKRHDASDNAVNHPAQSPFIDMNEFVASLNQTMESIPKRVPLILTVHDSVPARIVSDELKLFRSSLNLISNALSNTTTGSVQFHIYVDTGATSQEQQGRQRYLISQPQYLVFECTDTGRELQVDGNVPFKPGKEDMGDANQLGLFSVAFQIDSLGGSYGYRSRREIELKDGSVLWFQIPIVLPEDVSVSVAMAHLATSGSVSLMDDSSVTTLETSVIHYPGGVPPSPSLHQKHAITYHQPVPTSLSITRAGGFRTKGNRSFPCLEFEEDVQDSVNRSGILAVAAASMMPDSHSCCQLDELARFGGNIEAFKAHRKEQSLRSQSISADGCGPSLPRLRPSLSWESNGSASNDPGDKNRNDASPMTENALFRRTHSTGDSRPARLLKALLAKKAEDASKIATHGSTHGSNCDSATRLETQQQVRPPAGEGVPLSATVRIPNKGEPPDARQLQIAETTPEQVLGKPRPLFDTSTPQFDTAPQSLAQPQEAASRALSDMPKLLLPKTTPKPLFDLAPKSRGHTQQESQVGDVKPQAQAQAQVHMKQDPLEEVSAPRQKKALVIEDTLVVRKTLTRALQKRGYEVTQANDGVEGLEALKNTIFDITLCDFLMPNMDGLDCVQQYRHWEKANRVFQQHIVGISAHVSQNDVDKGLEIGMNAFRPKPITMKTLTELDESAEMDLVRMTLSDLHGRQGAQVDRNPEPSSTTNGSGPCRPTCLMATMRVDGESAKTARKMEKAGWDVTIVENGPSALEHLKSRNWGVVVLDDHLPTISGGECVAMFRAWENQNRVNRQDNLFIVCTDVVLSNPATCMMPPAGFDGAVDRQVSWESIQTLMEKQKGSQPSTRLSLSIISR
jgi:CheY-like chemotaxis protein/signal transduction histidine kinase